MPIKTLVSEQPLSIEEAMEWIQSPANGALELFIGTVRATNLGRDVVSVHYDLFVPLAEQTFQTLCYEVQAQHADPLTLYLAHFKGPLPVGGVSVIIAVGSPHREEAFSACRALIESLKERAPIWKQEHYTNGMSEWVKGHALCQHREHTHAS